MAQKKKSAPARAKRTRKAPAKRKSSWLSGLFASRYSKPLAFMAIFAIIGVGTLLYTLAASPTNTIIKGIGGKCLDNRAQRAVKGNEIVLWTCNGTKAQNWTIQGDGTIRLTANTNYCLDVKARGITSKTPVWLWPCNGTVAQQWKASNGTIVYNNPDAKPQLCLDDAGAKTTNGNPIWVYTCNGTAAQQWKAVKSDTTTTTPPATPPSTGSKRMHYIQNVNSDADLKKVISLGYNLIDVGSDSDAKSLPSGTKGLVWTGNTQCGGFDTDWNTFRTMVKRSANNSKVYGYYLSDEPDTSSCPSIAGKIRDRADYVHCLAYRGDFWDSAKRHPKVDSAGNCLDSSGKKTARKNNQIAYIVATDFPYDKIKDSITHTDYISLNPYPCWMGKSSCDLNQINREFDKAVKAGISKSKILPTYQAFGEECNGKNEERNWRTPSASEMKAMMARWDSILKANNIHPPFDDTYTWGPSDVCPPLSKKTDLQAVFKEYNRTH